MSTAQSRSRMKSTASDSSDSHSNTRTNASANGDPNGAKDSPEDDAGMRITYLGALSNVGLSAVKGGIGVTTGSAGLIADAVHSLSDLLSDAVTIATLKVVANPADPSHP